MVWVSIAMDWLGLKFLGLLFSDCGWLCSTSWAMVLSIISYRF